MPSAVAVLQQSRGPPEVPVLSDEKSAQIYRMRHDVAGISPSNSLEDS
jgi:hypothetical protein